MRKNVIKVTKKLNHVIFHLFVGPWIRIRIPNTDPDPKDPLNPDPDPKH